MWPQAHTLIEMRSSSPDMLAQTVEFYEIVLRIYTLAHYHINTPRRNAK